VPRRQPGNGKAVSYRPAKARLRRNPAEVGHLRTRERVQSPARTEAEEAMNISVTELLPVVMVVAVVTGAYILLRTRWRN